MEMNDHELLHEVPFVNLFEVEDSPAFPHRGVMLDTARNFIPVLKIKEVKAGLHEGKIQNLLPCQLLDSMSYSKLNVFHWHVTDSQVKMVDINTLLNISNTRFDFLKT